MKNEHHESLVVTVKGNDLQRIYDLLQEAQQPVVTFNGDLEAMRSAAHEFSQSKLAEAKTVLEAIWPSLSTSNQGDLSAH